MNTPPFRTTAAAALLLAASGVASGQETREFIFADVGTTYTGLIFPGDPVIGRQVALTRIFLTVSVAPGADAALFDTDISFPLTPLPGNRNALSISGADLDWSGSGTFTYTHETTEFNGTFLSTIFGAATPAMDAEILEGSRIEMVLVPIPAPAAAAPLAIGGVLALRRRR